MDRRYPKESVDGTEVSALVLTDDGAIPDGHRGGVHVEGADTLLSGSHQGSLWLHDGATVEISGKQQGSIHVGSGCHLVVTGWTQGSIHVSTSGEVLIAQNGAHQGSVHNEGRYQLDGTRGGPLKGSGTYVESPGSRTVKPEFENGQTYYRW